MIQKFLNDYRNVFGKANYYACPICLREFVIVGGKPPVGLTREHVPPRSLGGNAKCYTCAQCNNSFGAKADNNLLLGVQRNEKIFLQNLMNQKVRVKFEDGDVFQGQISINDDGTLTMYHSRKNNHPAKLDIFMVTVSKGHILQFNPILPPFDLHLLNVGLLKSAYLLVFEKLGYQVVNSPAYDIVRSQLMNPDDKIYFENTILNNTFIPEQEGIYFGDIEDFRFVCVVLKLRYGRNEIIFGIILPDLDLTNSLLNTLSYISSCLCLSREFSENSIFNLNNSIVKQYQNRLTCTFTPIG